MHTQGSASGENVHQKEAIPVFMVGEPRSLRRDDARLLGRQEDRRKGQKSIRLLGKDWVAAGSNSGP